MYLPFGGVQNNKIQKILLKVQQVQHQFSSCGVFPILMTDATWYGARKSSVWQLGCFCFVLFCSALLCFSNTDPVNICWAICTICHANVIPRKNDRHRGISNVKEPFKVEMLVPVSGNHENKEDEQEIQRRKGYSLCISVEIGLIPSTCDQKWRAWI